MQLTRTRIYRITLPPLACLLLVGQSKQTVAIDNFWTGNFNDSWNISNNWKFIGTITPLPRVPGDIDTAVLSSPANDTVRLYGNTAPINGLIVGNAIDLFTNGYLLQVDNAGLANTSIASGAKLTVDPRTGGVALQTDNLLLLSFGSLTLDGGDALVEGNTAMFSNGRINSSTGGNIQFGGNVSMDDAVLRLFNSATASFTANTTLTAEAVSIVDLQQQVNVIDGMSFNFQSGSRLEVMSLNIGNNGNGVGSSGSLLLDAAGGTAPRVDIDLALTVGHATSGAGLLDMKDSIASIIGKTTVLATGTIQLDGSQFAAQGDLLVDGGTITSTGMTNPIFLPVGGKVTATNGGTISIDGDQEIRADGTFEFFSEADLVITGTMAVGTDVGNTGTLTIDGASSTLNVGEDLIVGEELQQGTVKLSAGAVGSITGNVKIGSDGTGILTIESGAMLSGNWGRIGGSSASSGTATVTGTGSTWNNSSFLTIGSSGMGQLDIEAGGQVNSSAGFVAPDGNSSGVVTVGGDGSAWTISGMLSVGGGALGGISGDATLNVLAGGAVNVATRLVVYSNDLLRLAGGTLTVQTIDLRGGQFDWAAGTLHAEMLLDDIVNQGGTLAPGKPTVGEEIGLTTINGNYTQQAGGTLAIEIAGDLPITEYDQVSTIGFALFDGDLEITILDSFLPQSGDTFTVLSALGGIAGVFDNVATGWRLDTVEGIGSFLVHYGPGSLFDNNQIVLSDFQPVSVDLDNDGDVDGNDFLLIQRTNPALIPLWETAFGNVAGAVSSSTEVVPEPASITLLITLVFLASRKRVRLQVL